MNYNQAISPVDGSADFLATIKRNSYYLMAERVICPIINFLVTIFIIRKLSIENFGIYSILLALMTYIGLISALGLPDIFQRFIPEFYQKRQLHSLSQLIYRGLLARFIFSLVLVLILVIFSGTIEKIFKIEYALNYLTFFSIAIIFGLASGLLSIALTSSLRNKEYAASQISYTIFRAIILFFIIESSGSLSGLLIGESLAFVFLALLQVYFVSKFKLPKAIQSKLQLPIRRLIRFGGYSYFNDVGAQILSDSSDYFIISPFLGPGQVGIYAFAFKIMEFVSRVLPHTMLSKIIRPVFFTKYAKNADLSLINKMFNFHLKIIAIFSFPLVTLVLIFKEKLIMYMFDPKYLESSKILLIVASFTAINFLIEPVGLVLQSLEKVHVLLVSKIFVVYNLLAAFIVIKKWGIIGVAYATCTAVLFKNIFCYFFAKKYARLRPDYKMLGKMILNSLLMGTIALFLKSQVKDLISFILIIMLAIFIYLLFSYFNNAFSDQEKKFIMSFLPKRFNFLRSL